MTSKHKIRQSKRSLLLSAAVGVALSVLLSVLLAAGMAAMAVKERIPVTSIPYGVVFVQVIAALAGTILAGKLASEKKILACAAACVAYVAVLLGVALLFFDGQLKNLWTGLLAILLSGAAAIIVCAGRGRKSGASMTRRKRYSR